MSGNSQTLATNKLTSSDKKSAFMNREPPKSKLDILNSGLAERMRQAQHYPDATPSGTIVELQRMTEMAAETIGQPAPAPQPVQPPVPQARVEHPAPVVQQQVPLEDKASVSVPEAAVVAPSKRPKTKSEKSYSLDDSTHQLIARLSRTEAIRLDRRVPTSEILRHMINYAKANMKDDQVVPTDDGLGLHVQRVERK
ncbi:hypothetical protein [Mesorhizobium sp. SP-1A]|uniref:hypothetical protein n=1 Tax=Mesorhizobium sp. SP-1A TaxID=3077840 RepID=UPI0028F6F44E|nr:hypothetical protein [Mesorhizobium sp. SP-1A]